MEWQHFPGQRLNNYLSEQQRQGIPMRPKRPRRNFFFARGRKDLDSLRRWLKGAIYTSWACGKVDMNNNPIISLWVHDNPKPRYVAVIAYEKGTMDESEVVMIIQECCNQYLKKGSDYENRVRSSR